MVMECSSPSTIFGGRELAGKCGGEAKRVRERGWQLGGSAPHRHWKRGWWTVEKELWLCPTASGGMEENRLSEGGGLRLAERCAPAMR
ncbi:hypothetical protein L1887_02635 [Cichorium endivia]|nr:hypothetical protein L1887_02635 [Cichorium endivia]